MFIHGRRYQCLVCEDYDMCHDCFRNDVQRDGHSSSHPMLLIQNPLSDPFLFTPAVQMGLEGFD